MSNLTGQMALTTGNGIFSKIIRDVTHSPYSHMVTAINETECIGAEPGGVRVRPISYFKDPAWSAFPYSDWQRETLIKFVGDQLKVEYGYLDDVLIGVSLLTGAKTPLWVDRLLANGDSWQCAELCFAALNRVGIHVLRGSPAIVYPGIFVPYWQDFGWLPKS